LTVGDQVGGGRLMTQSARHLGDAQPLSGLASRLAEFLEEGEKNVGRLPVGSNQAARE
jgi:hypothetical protein